MKKDSTWGLNFIESLNPAKYNYVKNIGSLVDFSGNPNREYFGVMAQDIEKYIASQNENPRDFNILTYNDKGYLSVNYNELIGPLVKSVQELNEKIKKLEEKIND